MQIVFKVRSVDIAEVLRNRGSFCRELLLQLPQRACDLFHAACFLEFPDQLVSRFDPVCLSAQQFNCPFLIDLRHLLSDVAASRMDHQVLRAVCRAVDLNKVVSAAKCSKAVLQPLYISQF